MGRSTGNRKTRRASRGLVVAASLACACANAQRAVITPTLAGEVEYSNNVTLIGRDTARSDLITTITPGVSIDYRGAQSFLRGTITAPIVIYARDTDESNVFPVVNLSAQTELVKNFFFVEGEVNVSQTYFSPFGPRPEGVQNRTDNRYTAQTYRVSPYIQGQPTSLVSYSVRDDNIWARASDTPVATDDGSYTNRLSATINRQPTPFGWGVDAVRTQHFRADSADERLFHARVRGIWRPDSTLELFLTGGYESNALALQSNNGSTYGGGFRWRPTSRTAIDGIYERRFFGNSYNLSFDHRTPLTVWSLRATRDITTYAQELGRLPQGVDVPDILDRVFASRILDPTERANFVRSYINNRGLPTVLTEPLSLFSSQVYLVEYAYASVGLIGVRNSVLFSIFRSSTEAFVGDSDLPPLLAPQNNTTQTGGEVSWSYTISALSTLNASATYTRAEARGSLAQSAEQIALRMQVTRQLSPRTAVHAGARYVKADANEGGASYTETAVFAGFNHRFR